MQDLATNVVGNYTNAQLYERLTGDGAAIGCRFDILDSTLAKVGSISDLQVFEASISLDTTRDVVGSLGFRMLPNTAVNYPFLYRIQPWFRVQMLDGNIAEWPMGVYVWNIPTRNNAGMANEEWSLTLGDLCHILTLAGPGPNGFHIPAGANLTQHIAAVLVEVFGRDVDITGITHSTKTATANLSWGLTMQGTNVVTTWFDVLTKLHQLLGYHGPWFDAIGRYRAQPQPDLDTAKAYKTYYDGTDSILKTPIAPTDDLSNVCNRVIARGHSAKGIYALATADLNTLSPGHKLSQNVLGFYIDVAINDAHSSTLPDLQITADAELHRRLARYQQIEIDTLAWPVHEAYDIIGLQYSTDAEFTGDGVVCLETAWDFDLFTGEMTHQLQRITP